MKRSKYIHQLYFLNSVIISKQVLHSLVLLCIPKELELNVSKDVLVKKLVLLAKLTIVIAKMEQTEN